MYEEYDSTLFLDRFFPPSALAAEVLAACESVTVDDKGRTRDELTLAGALEAPAGALEACEAGALEATDDLGAIVDCWWWGWVGGGV